MLGFKSLDGAATILFGIEMVHMMRNDRRGSPTIHLRLSLPKDPAARRRLSLMRIYDSTYASGIAEFS